MRMRMCDQLKLWNVAERSCVRSVQAHEGFTRAICVHPNAQYILTVRPTLSYALLHFNSLPPPNRLTFRKHF